MKRWFILKWGICQIKNTMATFLQARLVANGKLRGNPLILCTGVLPRISISLGKYIILQLTFLRTYGTDKHASKDWVSRQMWIQWIEYLVKSWLVRIKCKNGVGTLAQYPHIAVAIKHLLPRFSWEAFNHPPYSPNLSPSDLHQFLHMKWWLGQNFYRDNEWLLSLTRVLGVTTLRQSLNRLKVV